MLILQERVSWTTRTGSPYLSRLSMSYTSLPSTRMLFVATSLRSLLMKSSRQRNWMNTALKKVKITSLVYFLCHPWTDFDESWQEARTQLSIFRANPSPPPQKKKKNGIPDLIGWEIFNFSSVQQILMKLNRKQKLNVHQVCVNRKQVLNV